MLIDANIFLEAALGQEKSKECQDFLDKITDGSIKAFTTDFIIDSIIIRMKCDGASTDDIKRFLINLLCSKGLTIFCLDFIDKVVAIEAADDFKMDFDDSLVLVAMKSLELKDIVSFDEHFNKIKWIKRTTPKQINRQ